PDKNNKKGKTLKLSYAGFFNQNNLLEKLMCTVEDVTESEEHLKKAEEDQENYQFISEIMEFEDKQYLAKTMEKSIRKLFEVLEDFVSPLSDTYQVDHFHKTLQDTIRGIRKKVLLLKSLEWKVFGHLVELEKFEKIKKKTLNINPQVEATSITCDMLETLLRFSASVDRFVPVNLNLNLSFTSTILEKIKDIQTTFTNLFEYVFLVRELEKIDKEKLEKVVKLARLYPEFERTIDLIQQRARLLSFLLKGVGEEELSTSFQNLSSKVKKMPERSRLTEFIIENNLIEPYKEILAKTKNIETELVIRIDERQQQFLDDKGYLLLLTELMKRFVKESKEGVDHSLPPLPEIEGMMIRNFETFTSMIKLKFEGLDRKEEEKEFIEQNIFNIESIFRRVLKKELTQAKALPIEKNNKKFIKFLRSYLLN
ncbi:MAG: hypothetical protein VYD54_06915, partial [Bdellovibrionota bacterium]|nr:hypothetical protein [Bdellovibrionota bacterium]